MKRMNRVGIVSIMVVIALVGVARPVRAFGWITANPDELQMTSEPLAPLAPAVYLYRQIERSDRGGWEKVYLRIKILTEAGRKYANAQIRFLKYRESIHDVEGRTIEPDGSIVNFDGKTYETPVAVGRETGYAEQTFAMPDAEVGSIVEYHYTRWFAERNIGWSRWILSTDLFTKVAKFSLEPTGGFAVRASWPTGLPPGTEPPKFERQEYLLESHDIPAFVTEEHMPPANELRYRVDFIYVNGGYAEQDPVAFWNFFGKTRYRLWDDFMDKSSAMEQAAKQITAPGDSPEVKLEKIYARVQQLRNLTFERALSEDEKKHQDLSNPQNVKQLWERGYGDSPEIALLFVALARAAGISADPVFAAARDQYFFDINALNPAGLSNLIAVVRLDGKELFLDPGNPYTPFGQLPWYVTAVQALRPTKDGGAWMATPLPAPADALTQRTAKLVLELSGQLHGQVTVTYSGIEATWRRVSERFEDEEARRKFLIDQLKGMIPIGSEITLTNAPNWKGTDPSLVATFEVRVDGWAEHAGNRLLLPVGLFSAQERHAFEHAARVHPVYFDFPFEQHDDISIELPERTHIEGVPDAQRLHESNVSYQLQVDQAPGVLKLQRDLTINLLILKTGSYDWLRHFYQSVRGGDEQQIVLGLAASAAAAGGH